MIRSAEQNAVRIIEKMLPEADDEDYTVFWIALAVTQQKKGRLLPEVKEQAVAMIDNGADLIRWEPEPTKVQEKRRIALEQARATLFSPMPAAKKR